MVTCQTKNANYVACLDVEDGEKKKSNNSANPSGLNEKKEENKSIDIDM